MFKRLSNVFFRQEQIFEVRRRVFGIPCRGMPGATCNRLFLGWGGLEWECLRGVIDWKMQRLLGRLQLAGHWDVLHYQAEGWITRGDTPEPDYRALIAAHVCRGIDLDRGSSSTRWPANILILLAWPRI